MDKAKKITARTAVVRVSRFAVPRPLMNEPMPCDVPMPRPPPSLRWISTTPISRRVTNRWTINRTVLNAGNLQNHDGGVEKPPGRDDTALLW